MANTAEIFTHIVLGGRKHRQPSGAALPTSPIVVIQLQRRFMTEDGVLISPHLMTENEIDSYINKLKQGLDAVGHRAKADLLSAR